jgi:hypothetical protein
MDKTRKVLHRSRIATFLVVQSQIKAVGGHKKDPGAKDAWVCCESLLPQTT